MSMISNGASKCRTLRAFRATLHYVLTPCLLLVLGAGSVQAQQAIDEIVVTATKRGEMSIQDIAGGIQAISGETLDDLDLYSLEQFSRLAPSMQFATQGRGDSQLIIRGIQSPGSSTVGFYWDEAVITGANFQDGGGRTPDIRAHDMQRVEILKGPQGTLFGASSMSGTVRLITNKPDASKFDANASVSGLTIDEGGEGYEVHGMVNVPLIPDVLAVRGVGWRQDEGGFIDQFVGYHRLSDPTSPLFLEDANDIEVNGGRIAVRWTPNDQFTLDAFGLVQETEIGGSEAFFPESAGVLEPIGVIFLPPGLVTEEALQGGFGELTVTRPSQEQWEDTTYLFGATLQYDLGFGTVLATGNYFDRDVFASFDTTPTCHLFGLGPAAVVFFSGGFAPPDLGAAPCDAVIPQQRELLSTEVRFSSDFEGPMNFVIGGYYQDESTHTSVNILHADTVTGLPICSSRDECLAAMIPITIFGREHDIELDFFALFGHVDYEISETVTIGGGLRYYDSDQRTHEIETQAFQGSETFTVPPAFGGPFQTVSTVTADSTVEEDEITFDAVLSYQPHDDRLYYFRAASGFRPGGINAPGIAALFPGILFPATFQPDTVESFEIGAKTSWSDDRLTMNVAYFKMYWDDIHVPGEEATGAFEFIANAASADIDGVELEIFARPADPWYLTFGVTWINAVLDENQDFPVPLADIIAAGLPLPPLGLDGDDIPKVPEWAFSGTAEYQFPFPSLANVDTILRTSFSYTDNSTTFFNSQFPNNTEIGGYFLLDLSASFVFDAWELKLFGTNITDERAITDIDKQTDGFDTFTVRPRTFGVQVNLHWE